MTTPATTGTEDIPLATVNTVGLSEVLSILALVASVCTALFGHDFGITKNAQAIAQLAVILIPLGLAHSRAKKHAGVAHANALVMAAQVSRAALPLLDHGRHAAPPAPPVGAVGDDLPVVAL